MLRVLVGLGFLLAGAMAAEALDVPEKPEGAIRFATFNVALAGSAPGDIVARLEFGSDRQAQLSAEVIQRVRPDVLLIQELDRDDAGQALKYYVERYLESAQHGLAPLAYPYRVLLPTNTGVATGVDLNADGLIGAQGTLYALDAKGFGYYPGQYAFALVSSLPLGKARTFTDVLWSAMPGHRMPAGMSDAVRAVMPLSSKTHALIPVEVAGGPITVVAAHPTPPIRVESVPRNADEIRLLVDLLHEARSRYAADDEGVVGGLPGGSFAVVMGDLNADPASESSDALNGAIRYLLDDPAVIDPKPTSPHGLLTAKFSRSMMRVDYVVPTANLEVLQSGVFWPEDGDRLNEASDHRLVWVDVRLPEPAAEAGETAGGAAEAATDAAASSAADAGPARESEAR